MHLDLGSVRSLEHEAHPRRRRAQARRSTWRIQAHSGKTWGHNVEAVVGADQANTLSWCPLETSHSLVECAFLLRRWGPKGPSRVQIPPSPPNAPPARRWWDSRTRPGPPRAPPAISASARAPSLTPFPRPAEGAYPQTLRSEYRRPAPPPAGEARPRLEPVSANEPGGRGNRQRCRRTGRCKPLGCPHERTDRH